ncbi:hypothetical protein G9A89_004658 [Geosiphon pyriformis]|nr:hypothetical protein G9A89_004658 [Geosiphon pyriformis]
MTSIVIKKPIGLTIDSTKTESLVKSDSKEDNQNSTKESPITTREEARNDKDKNSEELKKAKALA